MILSLPYYLTSISATERNFFYLELSFEQVDVAGDWRPWTRGCSTHEDSSQTSPTTHQTVLIKVAKEFLLFNLERQPKFFSLPCHCVTDPGFPRGDANSRPIILAIFSQKMQSGSESGAWKKVSSKVLPATHAMLSIRWSSGRVPLDITFILAAIKAFDDNFGNLALSAENTIRSAQWTLM